MEEELTTLQFERLVEDAIASVPEPPLAADDGCGNLDHWFTDAVLHPRTQSKEKPPLRMADLPAACRTVLHAP